MSEPMVIALISAGATLIVTVVTSILNVRTEVFRNKFNTHQKRLETKKENLNNELLPVKRTMKYIKFSD